MNALRISVNGQVQGVGWRPFVWRLAEKHNLKGQVSNQWTGSTIDVEGCLKDLERFLQDLRGPNIPSKAQVDEIIATDIPPKGLETFQVAFAEKKNILHTKVPKDMVTCDLCLKEWRDPTNRRYQYPFITCCDCGPRFSLVRSMPFERHCTTMEQFTLCKLCEDEYNSPNSRRFLAQTISCPGCGPNILLKAGLSQPEEDCPWHLQVKKALVSGGLVGIKGIGGYQVIGLAQHPKSLKSFRVYKNRPYKPLAIMIPNKEQLGRWVEPNKEILRELSSSHGPIVVCPANTQTEEGLNLLEGTAPGLREIGIMFPNNPIHHTITQTLKEPLIVTSANPPGGPIITDDKAAEDHLKPWVSLIVSHNRGILQHGDDSIIRISQGQRIPIRIGRGLAPIEINTPSTKEWIAYGSFLKNTLAVANRHQIALSPHLGNMEHPKTLHLAHKTGSSFTKIYQVPHASTAGDLHPDFPAFTPTKSGFNLPIQHHMSHMFSLEAEQQPPLPYLAAVFDGAGYSSDQTIWGGEFFYRKEHSSYRIGTIDAIPLVGGSLAYKEPRRSAMGVLFALKGEAAFNHPFAKKAFTAFELKILNKAYATPSLPLRTSSIGRLLDALSAFLDLGNHNSYEGEGPMKLEALALQSALSSHDQAYDLSFTDKQGAQIWQWKPMVARIAQDISEGQNPEDIAYKIHGTLGHLILHQARRLKVSSVLLSGGVFQNALLLRLSRSLLQAHGFQVYSHETVPPNDGGIAIGQAYAAAKELRCVLESPVKY